MRLPGVRVGGEVGRKRQGQGQDQNPCAKPQRRYDAWRPGPLRLDFAPVVVTVVLAGIFVVFAFVAAEAEPVRAG